MTTLEKLKYSGLCAYNTKKRAEKCASILFRNIGKIWTIKTIIADGKEYFYIYCR